MSSLSALLTVASLGVGLAIPQFHQGEFYYDGNKLSDESNSLESYGFGSFFTQTLDHFNRQDGRTFQQRYFVNDTFWTGADSNAPVFLCVGGEGPPLDRSVLVASVHCNDMVELAPKHGALLLALEHRYYGPSNPFDDLATENLQWLNTEQAAGDIASFYTHIAEEYKTTDANRWVTWGGSYPGMLAAIARLRYPHLIYASVSSSSPMQAAVDMTGYNNVVARSMKASSVGGSGLCQKTINEGHKVISSLLLTPEGQATIEEVFNVCPLSESEQAAAAAAGLPTNPLASIKNQAQFAGDGVVYLPVQSNDPACTSANCNIEKICETLTDDSVELTYFERLASLSKVQHVGQCVSVSYDSMIESYQKVNNRARTWLYQTCSEWGFYQTCEMNTECIYSQGLHTLDIDYDICEKAFNISKEAVNEQIEYTNAVYGGSNIQATRILYPNGAIDPWHALGVLTPPNEEQSVLWVDGASHHFWTHPSLDTDSDEVNAARVTIWNQVNEWLAQ